MKKPYYQIATISVILGSFMFISEPLYSENMKSEPAYTSPEAARAQYLSVPEETLDHITKARVALYHGNRPDAKREIGFAIGMTDKLENNPDNKKSNSSWSMPTPNRVGPNNTFKTVQFEYGDGMAPNELTVPIRGHQINPETLDLSISSVARRGEKISEAEVEYVTLKADKEDLKEKLRSAEKNIDEDDLITAEIHLRRAEIAFIEERDDNIPHLEKARDNLALARSMIRKEAFDAAESAVDKAEEELDTVSDNTSDKQRKQRIDEARKELASLSDTISRRDPSVLDRADKKLEEWWNEFSTWTSGKLDMTSIQQ